MHITDFCGHIRLDSLVEIRKDRKGHQLLDELERLEVKLLSQILDDDRRLEMEDFFSGILRFRVGLYKLFHRGFRGGSFSNWLGFGYWTSSGWGLVRQGPDEMLE